MPQTGKSRFSTIDSFYGTGGVPEALATIFVFGPRTILIGTPATTVYNDFAPSNEQAVKSPERVNAGAWLLRLSPNSQSDICNTSTTPMKQTVVLQRQYIMPRLVALFRSA